MDRLDAITPDIFLDGPGEYLAKVVCAELLKIQEWTAVFSDEVQPYLREDFSMRSLPALRVYNNGYSKTSDSGFVDGFLICDVLLPASIRREDLEVYSSRLTTALLQQFRRQQWFELLSEVVPGLNQLGTLFDVDKALVFRWGNDEIPMAEVRINFRIDLRAWDDYLERDARTKDDPFNRTLGNLRRIASEIRGLRPEGDEDVTEVTIETTTTLDRQGV